jgi:hypothetical protein
MTERVLRHVDYPGARFMQQNVDTALQLLTDLMNSEHDSSYDFALSELNIETRFLEVEMVLLKDIAQSSSRSKMVIDLSDSYSAGARGVIERFFDSAYSPWGDAMTATIREMALQWPTYVIETYGHGFGVQDDHPPPPALAKLKELVDPTQSKSGGSPFADPGTQPTTQPDPPPGRQDGGTGSSQSGGSNGSTNNTNPNPTTTPTKGAGDGSGRRVVDNRMVPNADPVNIVGPGIILDPRSDQQHGSSQQTIDANRDRGGDTSGQQQAPQQATDETNTSDGMWEAAGDAPHAGGGKTGGGTWFIDLDTGKKIFVPSAEGDDQGIADASQGNDLGVSDGQGNDGQGDQGEVEGEALASTDPGGSPDGETGGGTPDPDSGSDESAKPKGLPVTSWRHATAAQLLGMLRGLAAARLGQYAEVGYRSGEDLGAGGYNPHFADPEDGGGSGTSGTTFNTGNNPDPDTTGPSQGSASKGGGATFTGDPDNPWDAGGYNPHYQPWQGARSGVPVQQGTRTTSPVQSLRRSLLAVG